MRGLGDLFGGTKSYIAERQADDDGRVLGGLRYVRNAAGHDRLVVVTHYLTAGLKIPFTLPARRAHLVMRWRPADEIPAKDRSTENRHAYVQFVEGEVHDTLDAAERWLKRCMARLGGAG